MENLIYYYTILGLSIIVPLIAFYKMVKVYGSPYSKKYVLSVVDSLDDKEIVIFKNNGKTMEFSSFMELKDYVLKNDYNG